MKDKTSQAHRSAATCLRAVLLLLSLTFASAALADTVAHWRFEEGPAGSTVEYPQIDAIWDASGNGNHLRTWADYSAPTYVTDVPFDPVPQTGNVNDYALSFTDGNRDVYTADKPINSHGFDEITIEASFKVYNTNRYQVVVGKDGNVVDGAPPVSLKLANTGRLEFFMVDGSGAFRAIQTEHPLRPGVWYTAAATANPREMTFWMKESEESEYAHVGSVDIDGMFSAEEDVWVIGRGMWDGGNADFLDGLVDEVRISDVELDPRNFLGVYPEDAPVGQGTLLELSRLD